jgi:uncharacterized protein (UPF0333 family)
MDSGGKMKGQGEIGSLLTTFIILAIIIFGVSIYLGGLNQQYGVDDTAIEPTMSAAQEITDSAQNLENKTRSLQENPDVITATSGLIDVADVIWDTVGFVQALAVAIVDMTGLGIGWVVPYLLVVLAVVIALSIANWLRGGGSRL